MLTVTMLLHMKGRQLYQLMGKVRVEKMLTKVVLLAIKEIRCINVPNMHKLTLLGGMQELEGT
jgi:uncharacterized membrane protein